MSRVIAIGDIHGCHRELVALLARIQPEKDDLIVTLGDYIDRGPDSKGVVEELVNLAERCRLVSIKGNHEEMMEAAPFGRDDMRFWLMYGGEQTLESYKIKTYVGEDKNLKNIPWSHREFFKKLLPYYETDEYIFTHANYDPTKDMREQSGQILRWTHLDEVPEPHKSGKKVIVGHSVFEEVFDRGHLVCIDTGAGYPDGKLTAVDLTRNLVYSEKCSVYGPENLP
jgi:serine/threonine protein phosphatase 1